MTFGARAIASLQTQLQKSMQSSISRTDIMRQSYRNSGKDTHIQQGNTSTYTATGTATGTGESFGQLMLGITASVSGSLTTSWGSKSTVSGDLAPNTRVETIATQRRVQKSYFYEIPVTFARLFAVHYKVPAEVLSPPQPSACPRLDNVVARNIDDIKLVKDGKFRQKGMAETVSVLVAEHTVFNAEDLTYDDRRLYKK